jgi:iron complex outermembrane recepter protein
MEPRLRLLLVWCMLFLAGAACAQAPATKQTNVRVKVTTNSKEPLSYATVTVLAVPDTINKLEKITDTNGVASFQLMQSRPYTIRVTSVNYLPIEKNITVKGDHPTYTLIATRSNKALADVVVTATKPLMRQEDDKTIVDPENLAASSTNAYEIMEKIPGLFVDQDGNIYLTSTTPARVYINGREQRMSTLDVATLLKSLPPNAIASIEIIRTPSAKYDASTSGGIVNVVLRKGIKIGLTGSVTAGMNQGFYGNQYVGVNINNSNGRTSSYFNLQLNRRNTFEELKTNRLFAADSVLRQDAFTKYPARGFYLGYGLGFELNNGWELNYDGRISYNRNKNRSSNLSEIFKVSTTEITSSNQADVGTNTSSINITQSITLKKKLDSIGSEWTTDFSANFAPSEAEQDFITHFYIPSVPDAIGDGRLKNSFDFYTIQTNLVKKFPKSLTIEAGAKSSFISFHNTTDYFIQRDTGRVKDLIRTGAYSYRENINSAYLQGSKKFGGFLLKAGTRMENTNMNGDQDAPADTSFSIHRTDFFPYFYLSHSIMRIAGYELRGYLVFRRTIARPSYEFLNPAVRFVDPYLYEIGNPSLRPQFNKNYEANISVGETPLLAIGVNDTKDIFTQVVYQADSSESIAYRTWDNLGKNKEFYLRGLGAIPPGKKYFFVLGGQYNHNYYQGQYENEPLNYKRGSWTFFTYHTYKLTPLTVLTLSGFVRLKGQIQFYELSPFGSLNFSISQQFLKKKLTVSMSIVDMFYTNQNEFTLDQGSVTASGARKGDTRRFGLNLRYNFGLRKKEENNLLNVESPEKSN